LLTVVGQLKRKGKFGDNSEFMRKKDLAKNAISDPNASAGSSDAEANLLMFANLSNKASPQQLDDINGN